MVEPPADAFELIRPFPCEPPGQVLLTRRQHVDREALRRGKQSKQRGVPCERDEHQRRSKRERAEGAHGGAVRTTALERGHDAHRSRDRGEAVLEALRAYGGLSLRAVVVPSTWVRVNRRPCVSSHLLRLPKPYPLANKTGPCVFGYLESEPPCALRSRQDVRLETALGRTPLPG